MPVPLPAGVYLGEARRQWQFSRMLLTETTYGGSARLKPHAHERAHICIVLDGSYEEMVAHDTSVRSAGTATYLPASCEHAERHRQVGRHVIIELLPSLFECDNSGLDLPGMPASVRGPALNGIVEGLRRELARSTPLSTLALEGLALEAIAAASRHITHLRRPPRWLDAVNDVLDARFANPPTMAELGAIVGIHPTHLSRAYPRATGERIFEAIRRRRLTAAMRLLTSDLPLCEVAAACGFADQSHMTRSFKRAFGDTPARLRLLERAGRR